jgi:hypothetical protein
VADTATSSSLVFAANYTRDSDLNFKHPYPHVNGVEVIRSATVQGETYAFVYNGTNRNLSTTLGIELLAFSEPNLVS